MSGIAVGTATITATSDAGTATCTVTVHESGTPMTLTETFENMVTSGWTKESYTGDNGFIWNINAKGVNGYIDASKGIYMQAGIGAQSGTIPGGISSFSVTCKDLWSSGVERTIELLINGQVIDTFSHTGTEIYTYNVNNINIPGDITIGIRNTSTATLAIDNISWTTYTPSQYVETLENMTLEGWGSETYTGDNGITWGLNGRGGSGYINPSKCIYFKAETIGMQSGTIPNGISSFSVDCKDLWDTGVERKLQLLVNGVVIDTFVHTGTEIYTYSVENIDIPGNFTLGIKNATSDAGSNYSVAIDNITWTPYYGPPANPLTNLALNKPLTVSLESQPLDNPASNLVDGNTDTDNNRWAANGMPQWAEVDLGAIYSISKTELICAWDRAYQFIIEVKENASDPYTTIVDRSSNTQGGSAVNPITDNFTAINARYVKITVSGASGYTGSWVSLTEFRVFGEDQIVPDQYVETFELINLSTDQWVSNYTYTGDSGYDWTVNGKFMVSNYVDGTQGLYTNNGTLLESGTITGGISSFSVQCKNKWNSGTPRTIKLLVNGIEVGSSTTTSDNVVYTFAVNAINIGGNVTLALVIAGGTIAIDDISWTGYALKSATNEEVVNPMKREATRVFPNPFTSALTIVPGGNNFHTVRLIDINGQQIISKRIEEDGLEIILSDLQVQSGIYLLQLISKTSVETIKVLKNR